MVPPWFPLLALHLATAVDEGDAQGADAPGLASQRETGSGLDWTGELVAGWRFVDVDGSQAQYDEDLNLDSGPVLRELFLEGHRSRGTSGLDLVRLRASGIGDPQTSVSAEVAGSALRGIARYDRTVFEGNGVDDFHPFDFTRERASLALESGVREPGDPHIGVEVSAGRRDGVAVGTRSTGFSFLSDGVVRQQDETLGARTDVVFPVLGWTIDLQGGVQGSGAHDDRDFDAPSPLDPTFTQTESFRAEVDSTSVEGGLRIRRPFDEAGIDADLGVEYAEANGTGRMQDDETALFLPGDPFRRMTDADSSLHERWLQFDGGLRRQVTPDLAWSARFRQIEEESGGDLTTRTFLEEPPGSPPSPLTVTNALSFESRLQLLEVGLETALSASTGLDVSLEGGLDHEAVNDVTDGVPTTVIDQDLHQLGARAALSVEASRETTVTLESGYELAPTHDALGQTLFQLEDEQGAFASARVSWRPRSNVSFVGSLKYRRREIEAFGTDYQSGSMTLSGSVAASPRWSTDAAYSLRLYDLVADTVVPLLDVVPQQVPMESTFHGVQNVLTASVGWQATASFRPRAAASWASTTGDAEVRYGALLVDLPWKVSSASTLGAEVGLRSFDAGAGTPASDYDSGALLLYVRAGF